MKRIPIITLSLLLLSSLRGHCYEVNVHETMARQAYFRSNIAQYLSDSLDIPLERTFKVDILHNETARRWIELGSNWEDTIPRWQNHFYDPRDDSGLHLTVGTLGAEPSLQWGKTSGDNEWCWRISRLDYYWALTSSNAIDRNRRFANTFRGLGQIIHLVHDLAVPSHVRNDPHNAPFIGMPYDLYEVYTSDRATSLTYAGYPVVDNVIFNNFDSIWKNNGKGLAEFTNRNFVSRNTNFDDPAYQNYNAPVSTGEQILTSTIQVATYDVNDVPVQVPVQVNVRYPLGAVVDQYTGAVSQLVRLTAYSIFDYETNRFNQGRVYSQNDLVYKDYADILVPRTVGYSAGLLNYFFRGEINLEPGVTDPTRYVVRNKSAEDMYGTFRIFYDDLLDQRKPLLTAETQSAPAGGTTMMLAFDEPIDAKEPGKYIVVFKGTMGSENGAVVGKIGKPWPLEITPPDNLVYSIIDGSGTQQQFKHIKVKIRNADSSNQIQGGKLQAVARYKRRINYDPYLANELDATPYKESVFSYSVLTDGQVLLRRHRKI